MPGDWMHVIGCRAGTDRLFYQEGKGKFDFKPAADQTRQIMPSNRDHRLHLPDDAANGYPACVYLSLWLSYPYFDHGTVSVTIADLLLVRRLLASPVNIDEPITIEPYNPAWVTRFARERAVLCHALSIEPSRVEHIGSTSVVGMQANQSWT